MGSRLELQSLLVDTFGNNNVYFNPPSNIKLSYPCIKYKRSGIDTKKANNVNYIKTNIYELIVVGSISDDILDKLTDLPMCKFQRAYVVDSIQHVVLQLYY